MVNGVDKNNHLSLWAAAVHMLCLAISSWRTRMTQDASGTEEKDDSFLLSVCFAGSLSKPSPFLHTLTSSMLEERGHGRRQMLQQATENYEHKTETPPGKVGVSRIFLPPLSHSYGRGWKKTNELQKVLREHDNRDGKGNTLSSLKIPNSLGISDSYNLVTRLCYHEVDKGIDSRLFSCPYVSRTHKAPIME